MIAKYGQDSQVQTNDCLKSYYDRVDNILFTFELPNFGSTCEILVEELRLDPIKASECIRSIAYIL